MKTRKTVSLLLVAILVLLCMPAIAEEKPELVFDRYYITLPAIDLRIAVDKPGAIDTLYSGDEVELLQTDGMWAELRYAKDGEIRKGWTWAGAVAPAVRIHLLEDEFVFHKPGCTVNDVGMISTWREPTDPDLLVLWVEPDGWLYIMSLEEARVGYMSADAKYEIIR